MAIDAGRLVRWYGLLLGAGLALEGGLLLAIDGLRLGLPFATGDARHNTLHLVWGVVILGLLLTGRSVRRAALVAIVFGVFYSLLAILGVLVARPFGLVLGPGENGFHFIVGPLALALGVWGYGSSSSSSSAASRAATVSSASSVEGSGSASGR
jgi:hypothetical protein